MEKKRAIEFFVISLLVLSASLNFVVAQGAAAIFDPVKDLFAEWAGGNLSVNIAKYVLWLVLTLFIYSILAFVPFVKGVEKGKIAIRGALGILIGFLAMAYLTPSDVYILLASYSALGTVLSAVIPLIILVFFSIEMSREGGVGGRILSKVVWIVFIIFLIYKLVDGIYFKDIITIVGGWVYIGAILFSLLWIWFFEKKLLKILFKEELSEIQDKGKRDIAASLVTEIQRRNERSQNLTGAVKSAWDAKTAELEAELSRVRRL